MPAMLAVSMGLLWCVHGHAQWEPMIGCAPTIDGGDIEIEIVAPVDGHTLWLPANPSGPTSAGPAVEHRVRATARGRDITAKLATVTWAIEQEWYGTEPGAGDDWQWEFTAEALASGSPKMVTYPGWGAYPLSTDPGEHEGRIQIGVAVKYAGIYLGAPERINVGLAGQNPTRSQVLAELPTDRLRAIAWLETEGRLTQFDAEGAPEVDYNGTHSYDWGIMRLNDSSWADQMQWNYVAWNWKYNVQKGKWYFAWLADQFEGDQWNWTDQQKLDLRTYGYNHGYGAMQTATWTVVNNDDYVKGVRGFEVSKPWLGE